MLLHSINKLLLGNFLESSFGAVVMVVEDFPSDILYIIYFFICKMLTEPFYI